MLANNATAQQQRLRQQERRQQQRTPPLSSLSLLQPTFRDVEQAGPAMEPQAFAAPQFTRATVTTTTLALNPQTGIIEQCFDVLQSTADETSTTVMSSVAFWPSRHLRDAIFGQVWAYTILQERPTVDNHDGVAWEITNEQVAVKRLSRAMIQREGHRLAEDPLKEIAAMQLVGTSCEQVIGCHPQQVLQDDDYIYVIMPYCQGGDLFDVVSQHAGNGTGLSEPMARHCFKQLLQGVAHLQQLGICHRDMSLENVLVHEGNCKIIDFGMALRVPFSNDDEMSDDQDPAAGQPQRRLMTPQGTCGKWSYMSPEVRRNRDDMDGFAVDLWSVGVMLFILLTGSHLYEQPSRVDPKYRVAVVEQQGVQRLVRDAWGIDASLVSDQALDLLQQMLQEDPRDRLTLEQIWNHPWLHGETEAPFAVMQ